MWNAHQALHVVFVKMAIIWMSQGYVQLVLINALIVTKLNVILVVLAIMWMWPMILISVFLVIRVIVFRVHQIHVQHVKMDIM